MIPGMNAKQMKKMERQMKKMGMDMKDLKGVKEVIIRLEDKELVIPNAEVNLMNVMIMEKFLGMTPTHIHQTSLYKIKCQLYPKRTMNLAEVNLIMLSFTWITINKFLHGS